MGKIEILDTWRVDIIESERGWGSKVDESKRFPTRKLADDFIVKYNTKYNPEGPTPDWYMIATGPFLER